MNKSIIYSNLLLLTYSIFIPPVSAQSFTHTTPSTTLRTSRLSLPAGTNATVVIEQKEGVEHKSVLISDYLSSTKVIISEDGQVIESPSYYPYGESINPTSPKVGNNRYYTNQRKVTDDSTLYNYNARYYNPDYSYFIQPDSVEGPARYSYVAGNPIMNSDPSGNMRTESEGLTHDSLPMSRITSSPGFSLNLGTQVFGQMWETRDRQQTMPYSAVATVANVLKFHPLSGMILGAFENIQGTDMYGNQLDNTHALLNYVAILGAGGMGGGASGRLGVVDKGIIDQGERILRDIDPIYVTYSRAGFPENLARIPGLQDLYGPLIGVGGRGMVFADEASSVATKVFYADFPRHSILEADLLRRVEEFELFPKFIREVDGGVQMELINGIPSDKYIGIVPKDISIPASSRFIKMEASGIRWEFKPEHVLIEIGDNGLVTGIRLVDVGDFTPRLGPIPHIYSNVSSFMSKVGLNPWSAMD